MDLQMLERTIIDLRRVHDKCHRPDLARVMDVMRELLDYTKTLEARIDHLERGLR